MADAELAQKLAKRLAVADTSIESSDQTNDVTTTNQSINNQTKIDQSSNVSNELQSKLERRQILNDETQTDTDTTTLPAKNYQTIYTQFPEFSRKQLKHYESMFKRFDENKDSFLCLTELKLMFETLGAPQTHLALKKLMADVDEDKDNKINFREFLLIFRKAGSDEFAIDDSISVLACSLNEIDVHEAGVKKAQQFFDAKAAQLTKLNQFEAEIKQEQEEKRRQLEEKKQRRQEFQSKLGVFS